MKISDIISQRVSLESLIEKRKGEKFNNVDTSLKNSKLDSISLNRKQTEFSSIIEVQANFNKNMVSLNGLLEMERKVKEFLLIAEEKRDFTKLSKELSAIVKSVKYKGENVISYLSTDIKDETSLYTFRTNLSREIDNLKGLVAKERRVLASYLVESENRNALTGYSPEKITENLKRLILQGLSGDIHNLKGNSSKLLSV